MDFVTYTLNFTIRNMNRTSFQSAHVLYAITSTLYLFYYANKDCIICIPSLVRRGPRPSSNPTHVTATLMKADRELDESDILNRSLDTFAEPRRKVNGMATTSHPWNWNTLFRTSLCEVMEVWDRCSVRKEGGKVVCPFTIY